MGQQCRMMGVVLLALILGCETSDGDNGNGDDRTCTSGEFLVTAAACGVDEKGELTEFCIDGRLEEHSCNDPGDWANHDYTSGYVTGCSGNIHYQKWEQKTSAAANLVILNGRTEYVDKYHHLIPLLQRPWDIVMFDHYGQGRSDGVRAHAVDFDTQHVCDFGKVLESTTQTGIPTLVIAHSMGGFVAARYEELFPGKIDALVLSAPMFGIDTDPFAPQQAANMAKIAVDDGRAEENYEDNYVRADCMDWQLTHDCELYDRFKDDPLTVIGYPTYGWLYAALTGMQQTVADASQIKIPVMIFQAELDNSVLLEPQETVCNALEQCEIYLRKGDFHDLYSEIDRGEIVTQTLEFLDQFLVSP